MFPHYKHLLVAFARDGSYIATIMGGIPSHGVLCSEGTEGDRKPDCSI